MIQRAHAERLARSLSSRLPDRHLSCCTLSLIITEMYFRPTFARMTEYLAWPVLYVLCRDRAMRLSVGVAQVQLRHWVLLGFLESAAPNVARLRRVLSLRANYDLVEAYLTLSLGQHNWSPRRIAACYVGEVRAFYVRVLESAHCVARELDTGAGPVSLRCRRADASSLEA